MTTTNEDVNRSSRLSVKMDQICDSGWKNFCTNVAA